VKLSFVITINRSQGQTIPNVGIYLPWHVFNHVQLYVALSRGISQTAAKILIKEGHLEGEDENFTKNVVYKDILLSKKSRIVHFMWIFYLNYLLLYIKGNIIYKESLQLNENINTNHSHIYLHK